MSNNSSWIIIPDCLLQTLQPLYIVTVTFRTCPRRKRRLQETEHVEHPSVLHPRGLTTNPRPVPSYYCRWAPSKHIQWCVHPPTGTNAYGFHHPPSNSKQIGLTCSIEIWRIDSRTHQYSDENRPVQQGLCQICQHRKCAPRMFCNKPAAAPLPWTPQIGMCIQQNINQRPASTENSRFPAWRNLHGNNPPRFHKHQNHFGPWERCTLPITQLSQIQKIWIR